MAIGDKAAAAGLATYSGVDDARKGYEADNQRGDELATHMVDGGHPFSKITGTATNAQLPVIDQAKIPPIPASKLTGTVTSAIVSGSIFSTQKINGAGFDVAQSGAGFDVAGSVYTPIGRSAPVTSNWVAAGLDGAGRLGAQPSARRYKKFIKVWNDIRRLRDLFKLNASEYQLRRGNGAWEIGWIAEDVVAAGFGDFVPTDTNPESEHYGEPISVDYARFVVPLLELVKTLDARIEALEARE